MHRRVAAALAACLLLPACGAGPHAAGPAPAVRAPAGTPAPVAAPADAGPPAPAATLSAVAPPATAGPAADPATALDGVRRFTVPEATGQVVVVTASTWDGTRAELEAVQRDGDGRWRTVLRAPARLGSRGLTVADERRQGSRTTPAGVFGLTSAFGREPDPGSGLPYTRVDEDHWWVGEPGSPFYNQLRRASQGGFTPAAPSEHLVTYDPQYDHAVVIDFNRPDPVPGRGAAIFLHVDGAGATAGCVSVPEADLEALLRWLDPARSPLVVIGEDDWLAATP